MKKTFLLGLIFCAAGLAAFAPESGAAVWQEGRRAAGVYYRDGARYALEGRLDEAAAAFEQAVALDPRDGNAQYSLGNVYAEQGRWAAAVDAYRRAVVLNKNDGEAYNGLGVALGASGAYEQAAAALNRAVEIYPKWAEPRFHLSRVYKRLGRDVAAQVAYSEAVERRPDYATHPPRTLTTDDAKTRVEPRSERASAARSGATPARAETPRVSEPTGKVAPSNSNDAAMLYDLGTKHGRAGRHEEAVAAFRQAVRLDRNNAATYTALGDAYAQLGRWREAVDSYEQAVRLNPKDASAYEVLGRAYAKLRETATPPAAGDGERAVGVRAATNSGATADAARPRERSATQANDYAPVQSPVEPNVAPSKVASAGPTESARPAPAATDAGVDPATIYRVGPGDVLDVRVVSGREPRTTAYTVTPTGLLDHRLLGEPLRVEGLTTDEIAARLASALKPRADAANPEVSVGVREYASHAIIVSGLVKDSGTKLLRREGVPLYVIVAHAQPLAEAGRVLVVSRVTGRTTAVDLSDAAAMNMLVRPGDVLTVQAMPKQYFYIAGAVRQPGQKDFHNGLTLTQALLAAGGVVAPPGASEVTITRQGLDGRLASAVYSLKDIGAGKEPDPLLRAGDRIEVVR